MTRGSKSTASAATRPKSDDRLLEDRRKLGAFYTPERLSRILSDWAVRKSSDTVLEPSFGGCGFLEAARESLSQVGCSDPRTQIYGCDVDPVAFDYLANVLGSPVDLDRFHRGDFLQVAGSSTWPAQFSAILANPPYIPYQAIAPEIRLELMARKWAVPELGGRAGLWAYFIAHSLGFLEKSGRMAWVLPGAFLQADYAKSIRSHIEKSFSSAMAIVLRERIFLDEGTDEETVILLAEGYLEHPAHSGIQLGEVNSLDELVNVISDWTLGKWTGHTVQRRPAALSFTQSDIDTLSSLSKNEHTKLLGDIATIQIGLVTGANDFFVLTSDKLKEEGLVRRDCKRIFAKFQAAPGLAFHSLDHTLFAARGGPAFLVDGKKAVTSERLSAYFSKFDPIKRAATSTFKKRRSWCDADDGKIPDAFFPVMNHYGPRLLLNPDQMTCTNTIHRVYFKGVPTSTMRKLYAISILTTYSQLNAELMGRRYGSGVLKHEPREAEKISILLPNSHHQRVSKYERLVDAALRAGNKAEASRLADELIYSDAGIPNWQDISAALAATLSDVRERRRPRRPSGSVIAKSQPTSS